MNNDKILGHTIFKNIHKQQAFLSFRTTDLHPQCGLRCKLLPGFYNRGHVEASTLQNQDMYVILGGYATEEIEKELKERKKKKQQKLVCQNLEP